MATVGLAGLGTMGLASAATATSTNPQQSIIDKLVSKFNLNKEEVQKVFDQDRAEHQAAREAEVKTKLDSLVKEGKLTQAQEDKLIAKAKEMQSQREANRESFKDKTEAERKAAFEKERTAFSTWLSNNGIAEEYGRLIMGGPGGRGGPDGPGGPPPQTN